jgi:Zn-dependent protease with chaperone function
MQPTVASVAHAGSPAFALAGTIVPTRVSLTYRFALAVVAVAMLVLPVIYISAIVGAAWLVWWHATTNISLLDRVSTGSVLVYATPIVVGTCVVFFMVKPILARPARKSDPVRVSADEEPRLFAFIAQICGQVGAPMPQRVQVDCQVNASAGFLPGPLSVVNRDLVLTIGLPLAAGLSVRELGGVLAHEFGHFAQGGAMRLTTVVRGVNAWFARVVYERDHWDEKLAQWSKEVDGRVAIVLLLARGSVWLSRGVLFGLMMAGHAISCFMLRQMEYDADSYEVKFAGSAAFARTAARLRELNAGAQLSYNDLRHAWQQRALPADLATFMVQRSGQIPDALRTQLHGVAQAKTGVFDTHPSDADRVRAADASATAGVLVGGDETATTLFRNFETLSSETTRHHYMHDLGLEVDESSLVGVGNVMEETRRRERSLHAVEQFLGERRSLLRPLRVPLQAIEQLSDSELVIAANRARESMALSGDDIANTYRRIEELEAKHDKAFLAEELLTAGLTIGDPQQFDIAESTFDGAASAQRWAIDQQKLEARELEAFEESAGKSLAYGLALASRKEASLADLCRLFNAVSDVVPHVHGLRRLDIAISILVRAADAPEAPATVRPRIQSLVNRVNASYAHVRRYLGDLPCPPSFSSRPMSAVQWCGLSAGADALSPPEVIERLLRIYTELLGQIVAIAMEEQIENGAATL